MVATGTMPTQAQCVAIAALPTIPMQACQHHGWLNRPNAQDHPAVGTWPHTTPHLSPPAAAAPTATPTRCILPHPRHECPTRVFLSNPTCWWHLPPVDDHGHAGSSARSNHDEFCWPAFPPSAGAAPMMQQPTHQAMPMMAPYYASNQQTYSAPNQQHLGHF